MELRFTGHGHCDTAFMICSAPRAQPQVRQEVGIPIDDGTPSTFLTFSGLKDSGEHFAIAFGDWKRPSPLVRLHSECITGDLFNSHRCDCGAQLREATTLLTKEGGLLLYLRQEGRGIGLYNKLDAYAKQSAGLDTFEANRALGFVDDARDYEVAAQMLQALGVNFIELLTNNPEKKIQLEQFGVRVHLRQTGLFVNSHNHRYLIAKKLKSSHLLNFGPELT